MTPLIQHTGIVATLNRSNVDTDAIIPKQFLKSIKRTGYGPSAFFDWRYTADGEPDKNFELNQAGFEGRSILVTRNNFGCGSSREHAAMEPRHIGVKAVIVKSFARIHRANLINFGILPLVLDDPSQYDGIEQGDKLKISGLHTGLVGQR